MIAVTIVTIGAEVQRVSGAVTSFQLHFIKVFVNFRVQQQIAIKLPHNCECHKSNGIETNRIESY